MIVQPGAGSRQPLSPDFPLTRLVWLSALGLQKNPRAAVVTFAKNASFVLSTDELKIDEINSSDKELGGATDGSNDPERNRSPRVNAWHENSVSRKN